MSVRRNTTGLSHSLRKSAGFSIIEVLVAVLVLSIGLLGIARMQIQALKNNQSSLERSQSSYLAYYIIDAMRVNRAGMIAGNYNLAKTCATPADNGTLSSHDLNNWFTTIKANLGNNAQSCGEISCVNRLCTVRIYWNDQRGSGGSSAQMFETVVRL